jgi:putative membrane-bound dehydrogenase-like protein
MPSTCPIRWILALALSSSPLLTTTTTKAADAPRHGPEAAREQLKAFTVAEGLQVTLFASEPMLRNPANMDIDARGRVWVTEGANYRLFQKWGKLRPEGDRIVILEDTNNDGAADREKTFYQGNEINTALGICVLGSKIIVSCSPTVWVFTDANNDDVADGPPQALFTGIKGVDHDHGVHAFVFGPDGKLYFNFGNDGKDIRRPDGTPVTDPWGNVVADNGKPYRQGMVFRCNADGSGFEVLGHNFRNNYEVCVDSFGTLWQSDNDDDGNQGVRINYVMEHGNFGYRDEATGAGWQMKRTGWEDQVPLRHWHLNDPGVVPNLLQTGAGSPTGILIYEGKLLPAAFHNQLIHCDAGPRVVRAYLVSQDGAGYRAEIKDVLTSTDSWFRPSDVCTAPDGSLYVADWNDAGVGGHMMADQKVETMTGRIYRVAPRGHKANVPAFEVTTTRGAVGALQSPNQATRYLAWTALQRFGTAAEQDLLKLWRSQDPRLRTRALHALARMPGAAAKYVDLAMRDTSSDVRIAALRIARERTLDVPGYIRTLAKDTSPQVRREAALALFRNTSPDAPALWADLARQHDGKDRWYLEALGIGAEGQWDACLAAWLKSVGDAALKTPAGRDIVWRSRSKDTPALLVRLIRDSATTPKERDRYMRSLDFIRGPEKEKALLELLSTTTTP